MKTSNKNLNKDDNKITSDITSKDNNNKSILTSVVSFILDELKDNYLELKIVTTFHRTYFRKKIYKNYLFRSWGNSFEILFEDELNIDKLHYKYYRKKRLDVKILGCSTPKPNIGDFVIFPIKIRTSPKTFVVQEYARFIIYKVDHLENRRDFYKATIGYLDVKSCDWLFNNANDVML